jgi:arylsulfatase A-like enzyme
MTRSPKSHLAALAIASVAALFSSGARPVALRPSNVILITLDTTRADHLPPYGSTAADMAAIDRLAREGVVFDEAMTAAPLTLPAHASVLTGRNPPDHGVRDNAGRLAAEVPTLAALLHASGFRTAAFVSSVILDADRGLGRGFDLYSGVNGTGIDQRRRRRRPADEVIDDVVTWLTSNEDSRIFAWVHLYDAHAPYALPEPYQTGYAADPYSGALTFADSQIARLLAFLDSRRQLAHTAVIVAADHGESLGDHGEQSHGIFIYESVLHVPLIVRWPHIAPKRVTDLVRLIDLAPTILALEHVAAPPMDGTSLIPLLTGASHLELDGYAESMYPRRFGWSQLRSFRAGRFKLIEAPRPELYDLQTDPGERHDLYSLRPATARTLLARLQTFKIDARPAEGRDKAEVRERLASLGYIGSVGAPDADDAAASPPDPKDVIHQYNALTARMQNARRSSAERSR